MNTVTAEKVEVRRKFPVTRERLFQRVWTDPALVKKWFGPEGVELKGCEIDARVGGQYAFDVFTKDGEIWRATGEYREITPPSKLVYTWRWDDDPAWDGFESLVTINFNEVPEGSEVHLIHERFPTEESRNNHEHGWGGCLDKLARLLATLS